MEKAIQKADILIEALPYIVSFRNKIFVIKLGGAFMGDPGVVASTLIDVVFLSTVGIKPVIVHGGGPEITQRLRERGTATRFVQGRRYTDEATLEVVHDILIGEVNGRLVKIINENGGHARPLHTDVTDLIRGTRLTLDSHEGPVDLGLVGRVDMIDTGPIRAILDERAIPVIAPLGRTVDGEVLNINADSVASKVAGGLGAEKFVMVSDTHGILTDKDNPDSLASTLSQEEIYTLISKKAIDGGMLPKVESCLEALRLGVRKSHIIDGRIKHSLLLEIFTDTGIGTQIVHD
jgi:acetylglutamate kinase